ncbi:uncharacterized protein A1O9_03230 [Exophiala aquamarina CBS 119918]|uniref:Uncharacterized protein n=1 Tax=Exophiala aquamarina CBS 119918 TaxID=1182545 RepID=A0A072PPJ1_9EURO|nr:uncharacterized protein A1O9_03230 [Exophiala aquamarina CBS 119918]KEF61662.1 hypothetical protein A1O9_03230 [Exophiala aquamarina CBS 119918]
MTTIIITISDSITAESCPLGSHRATEDHLVDDDDHVPSKCLEATTIAQQPRGLSKGFAQQSIDGTLCASDTPDSGYGSIYSSQKSSPDDSQYRIELNSNRPIFRKKSTLRVFNTEIPDLIVSRFLDQKELFTEPSACADVESAKPYIRVMCDESIKKKVREYFIQARVKEEFQRAEDNVPPLDVIVDGRPMSICATTGIDIYADGDQLYGVACTLCGKWIKATIGTQDRIATIGGVIEVINKDGARHNSDADALSTSSDEEVEDEEESNFELILDDNEKATKLTTDQRSVQHRFTIKGVKKLHNIEEWSRIGHVITVVIQWVLFWPGALIAELHIVCTCSIRRSLLAGSPSFVLTNPGTKFVEMYTVALNCEFSFGDSGTWVIGESDNKLYGHVTGKDVFGDAYVMPIEAIFDDIAMQMDCKLVSIPENDDARDLDHPRSETEPELSGTERPHKDRAQLDPDDIFSARPRGVLIPLRPDTPDRHWNTVSNLGALSLSVVGNDERPGADPKQTQIESASGSERSTLNGGSTSRVRLKGGSLRPERLMSTANVVSDMGALESPKTQLFPPRNYEEARKESQHEEEKENESAKGGRDRTRIRRGSIEALNQRLWKISKERQRKSLVEDRGLKRAMGLRKKALKAREERQGEEGPAGETRRVI